MMLDSGEFDKLVLLERCKYMLWISVSGRDRSESMTFYGMQKYKLKCYCCLALIVRSQFYESKHPYPVEVSQEAHRSLGCFLTQSAATVSEVRLIDAAEFPILRTNLVLSLRTNVNLRSLGHLLVCCHANNDDTVED